ncbi:unnamed protein product [Polarella glacialis]|uniref:Uncharacterized protein n=1 Tax=Polarella glacialis TaxID=89957 RepID=A0A813D7P2_POLGL|nr:unnamed protein product [Polarella glacialis]
MEFQVRVVSVAVCFHVLLMFVFMFWNMVVFNMDFQVVVCCHVFMLLLLLYVFMFWNMVVGALRRMLRAEQAAVQSVSRELLELDLHSSTAQRAVCQAAEGPVGGAGGESRRLHLQRGLAGARKTGAAPERVGA